MIDISFSIDYMALLVCSFFGGASFLLWRWRQNFHAPHLKYSQIASLQNKKANTKAKYIELPQKLMLVSALLFALAFIDPHYFALKEKEAKPPSPLEQVNVPSEGLAIYLVLDKSGSMSQTVKVRTPAGRRTSMTKMDLLKKVTHDFVAGNPAIGLNGRPNDMIGLVSFARGASVLSPLTLDHNAIVEELAKLNFVRDLKEDGTSIGYAIFKATNLIAATKHYAEDLIDEGKPAYEMKSMVMILVTDGFQSPSPLDHGKRLRNIDMIEAAKYAKENKIRLYVINVDPRIGSEEFAAHRTLLNKVADLTGGKFYMVDESMDLAKIYTEIDTLEKSTLPIETGFITPSKEDLPNLYRRISFYPFLIALGMSFLFIAITLSGTLLRRVP